MGQSLLPALDISTPFCMVETTLKLWNNLLCFGTIITYWQVKLQDLNQGDLGYYVSILMGQT